MLEFVDEDVFIIEEDAETLPFGDRENVSFSDMVDSNVTKWIEVTDGDLDYAANEFWRQASMGLNKKNTKILAQYVIADGGLFDANQEVWNLFSWPSSINRGLNQRRRRYPGITNSYSYRGTKWSCFPWHVENMNLYSVNYLHKGYPKTWYSILLAYARKFEVLSREIFQDFMECDFPHDHKTYMLGPKILNQYDIPFVKVKNNFCYTFI